MVLHRVLGGEHDLPYSRARRSRQAGGQHFDLLALLDKARNQEVVELVRLDAEDGLVLRDQPLAHHVDGDAHRGQAGPLAVARLQHVERPILDGELEVLHIAIVFFHLPGHGAQMVVDLGHGALKLGNGQGRADAADDIFALRVHEVLAEEDVLAGGRVAGKAHAGPGALAQVAEDHGLHVYRRAQPVVDVVDAPVGLGAIVLPTAEDGVAGLHQLIQRPLRKVLAGLLAHQLLVFGDDLLQRIGPQFVVELHGLLLLDAFEDVLEFLLRNIQHHVAEHLDQAAVGIIGKAGILAALRQGFDGVIVQAEVQNRVHHAGHGELGAGADRNQQRVLARAQLLSLQLLQPRQGGVHLNVHLRADRSAHVFATGLGLNGKARGHRQPGVGHLRQARALAAQHVLHLAVAVGRPAAEEIHILDWG